MATRLRLWKFQEWRDALLEARLSGVRRVRDQNGEEIEYRSDAEIAQAIAAADAEIRGYGQQPVKTIFFKTSKGI